MLPTFVFLFGLGLIGLLVAVPWPFDPPTLAIGAAVLTVLIGLGLMAARPFGRGAPIVDRVARREPWRSGDAKALALAFLSGALVGAVLLALLFALAVFEPGMGARLAARAGQPWWMPWALAVEASILEQFVFRLFLMSGIVWLLARLGRPGPSEPSGAIVWSACVASAVAFGLAHLPPWLAIVGPAPLLIALVLLLNGLGGVVFGHIYWRWGIEAAILCHFAGDLVIQGIGPRLFAP